MRVMVIWSFAARLKIYATVTHFFGGDHAKAALWFATPSPLLGGKTPRVMMMYDDAELLKLAAYIRVVLQPNDI